MVGSNRVVSLKTKNQRLAIVDIFWRYISAPTIISPPLLLLPKKALIIMEEPPKIERILSSRGVSLSDAASLLESFLSNIDQYHGHHDEEGGDFGDDALDGGVGGRRQEELAYENDNVDGRGKRGGGGPRKSWQEREEEALIAQMDQLANDGNSASGISDDVLERLRMITQSICAEVEGKPLSASGMMTSASRKDDAADDAMMQMFKEEEEGDDVGADDFIAESDAREEGRRQQHQPKKDKKKEKKAKKAAKKAKKDAKRKRAI